MVCKPNRARSAIITWGGLALIATTLITVAMLPGHALAAKLIGGRQQAAVKKAFSASAAGRHALIVSIRASTVAPAWTVVRWVAPGHTRLHSSFFHLVSGHARPGTPPQRARADLNRDFRVAVVYRGSGAETVNYQRLYTSVCAGGGGFTEQQSAVVSPMSWTVRYIVDLDRLAGAAQGPQGDAVVPELSVQSSGSQLKAIERLSRTYVDHGCFNSPTHFNCRTVFHLSPAAPALSFDPGLGTEIGIPMVGAQSGQCSQNDYTIGPSLWDSGASTVLVRRLGLLGLLGSSLPGDPYAPIHVSWPGDSAALQDGFLTSPCQGITAGCSDQMRWQGIVQLQPASAG